jgi:hypothetical protein
MDLGEFEKEFTVQPTVIPEKKDIPAEVEHEEVEKAA